MDNLNKVDVLFVGAGPASLAGAIKLKQFLNRNGRDESVIVIEKANKVGWHNLSVAVFEADVLDELITDWRERKDNFVTKMLANKIEIDEKFFLLGNKIAVKLPEIIMPSALHHKGDYIISVSEMVNWLAGIARDLGVEIYTGFAAKELIIENNSVRGVKIGEKGMDKEGKRKSNYIPRETIEAKVTILGEGSLGQLSEELVNRFTLGNNRNPKVYAVGIKEIFKLPEKNNFGSNRLLRTLGFPNKLLTPDVYGGGTLCSLRENMVAVVLILGLDWRYCDLNPQQELQVFKSHSLIKRLLEEGQVIAYGAKLLTEGGYYALTGLVTDGAVIIGDAAGLTNVKKLKGMHYAIKSGILAAETIHRSIEEQDFTKHTLKIYEDRLNESFIMKEMYSARNFRQVFAKAGRLGTYAGMPVSFIQQWLPRLNAEPDYKGMSRALLRRQYSGGIDRLTAVSFSGTTHREDEPSHITFLDQKKCTRCVEIFGCHPCAYFCPGEVYRFEGEELFLSPSNCLHCQTCRVKCPSQVIKWEVPEGGDGPRYKMM